MAIRGWFVWEELMTTDVASAGSFYKKVGGLKTKQAPFDPNYTMFEAAKGNMGGLMALPAEAKAGGTPPCWISYIGTPDADETARHATALGVNGGGVRHSEKLRLVERFTPISAKTMEWKVTVEDPDTWVKPWTFALNLTKDPSQPVFEYACHEGNYAIRNILSAARSEEKP